MSSHPSNGENKSSTSEKNGNKGKGISKLESDKKDKYPIYMESMQQVIKQLTNEIIDLKKNKGEGKKPCNPFFKNKTNMDTPPPIPSTSGINFGGLCYREFLSHSSCKSL